VQKLKVLSLFSGVGGLDNCFIEDDNFEVVGFSEIDKFPSSVLEYHHPNIKNYGDITKSKEWDLPEVDMMIGGFSCVGFSVQGSKQGLDNAKSGLFNFIPPLIKRLKPKYVLLENVTGLLMKNMEKDFEYIKKSIEKEGYTFKHRVQDSSKYRTAQQRLRVFMLCVRKDIKQISESDSLYGGSEPCKIKGNNGVRIISYSKSTRKGHKDYRIRTDGLINTLTTGSGCAGASTATMVVAGKSVRVLTPRECEALMCWKHNHTKYGMIDGIKTLLSDSVRYRMCGNGVVSTTVVPFKEEILMMEKLNFNS